MAARLSPVISRSAMIVASLALGGLAFTSGCGGNDGESGDLVATTTPGVVPLDVLASVGPVSPPWRRR